ncbi:HNH endonuclease domain-containing protein [Hydrogenothermus marinus]|uniref:HNH endonuclease n=1 Tax=Hydrogenothermus marinus TaxID=133270 RepID=A0A3M0C1Y7_9AQUI|nr:HNH endonuclease domain-containing protein [Hydrogenothermus marinus]RMA96962.1 HNH endonuclease [Hydrogenothermus marinus]
MQEAKFLRRFIERESKYASYKFALLRGIIEIIQEYDHLKLETEEEVSFPLGLLIEKWIFYYYPLIENNIPQIYGKKALTFRKELEYFIEKYKNNGGFLQFYNDYRHSKVNFKEIKKLFTKIKTAIYTGPMKHLGYTTNKTKYSIFRYENPNLKVKSKDLNIKEYLINNYGYIKFDKNLYILLKEFGSFINGTESIIFKWAKFSKNIDNSLNQEEIISLLLKSKEEIERDVYDAKKVYDKYIKNLRCVWTNKKLTKKNYEVDHALPYSITYINDLWNLLPAHSQINRKKSDMVPTPSLIESRKNQIKYYWNLLLKEYKDRFKKEVEIGLTGRINIPTSEKSLFNNAIDKLKQRAEFLIDRGYEPWKP